MVKLGDRYDSEGGLRMQWTQWAQQDYIQSQCQDAITRDVTSGDVNLVMRYPLPPSPPSLKVENTELFRRHPLMLCHDSQSVLRLFQRQWHLDGMKVAWIYQTDIESDTAVKTTVAVCEYTSSYNTTMGLSNEHRHDVVKFSNVSGTSTTDTVQKGWLNRPCLMIENGELPLLLMLLANGNADTELCNTN